MKFHTLILSVFLVLQNINTSAETKMETPSDRKLFKGNATLVIKRNRVEEFKALLSTIIEPTRKEEGCIRYEAFQLLDENGKETNRFEFHELWKDEKAMLVDHKENSPHMKVFFKKLNIGAKDSMVESFSAGGAMAREIMPY